MSDLKIKHARNKSSIDKNVLKNHIIPTSNSNMNTHNKLKRDTVLLTHKTENRTNFGSNTPSLIKLTKAADNQDFNFESKRKNINENEIKNIIDKYEDINLNNKVHINEGNQLEREKEKGNELQIEAIDDVFNSKNKNKIPILNLKCKSTQIIQHEQLFDPVTERDCSFINNISVDNSNFVGDLENKDNDVVLCISSLEVDVDPYKNDKKFPAMNILQSEEKFIKRDFLDEMSNTNNNEKNKLIGTSKRNTFEVKYKKRICCFIILTIMLAVLGCVTFAIVKHI